MHPLCHFKPVLALHRVHPIDLQSKCLGWLLYNGNTADPRQHLFFFLYIIFNFIEDILHPFPQVSNVARINLQKQRKNH